MVKPNKFLALLTALSISLSVFSGFTFMVNADETDGWSVQYTADTAVHSNPEITVDERSATIGGMSYTFKFLGSISGGINEAAPGEYNGKSGGTATFKVTVDEAGKYDVMVTGFGAKARRVDLAVGDTVYPFPTDTEDEYASYWTAVSDEGSNKDVFSYTFEGVDLAAGENPIVIGTKVDGAWAPDIVGIDVTAAAAAGDGISYKKGTVTVKAADVTAAKLIYATYKSYNPNEMKTAKVYDLTFNDDGIATQAIVDAEKNSKLFVWYALDGDNAMKPVCPSYTVTDGVEVTDPTPTPTGSEQTTPTPEPTPTPTPDPKVTVLDEKFTSDSVTDPADSSYTWGDIASMLADKKGLTLTNGNNASNNYENKDIVTFKDAVGDTGNKINLSYNLTYQGGQGKGQSYTNYVMSYYNANGKLMFSITESIGDWNDKAYIEYADSETTTAKEEIKAHMVKGATTEVKAEVKFGTGCGYITIDGKMYRFVTDSTLKNIKATVSGGQDYTRGICITNYKMTTEPTVLEEYCLVEYDVDGKMSSDSVVSGNAVDAAKMPSTEKKGFIFDGWQMGDDTTKLYTTEDIKAMTITADVKFTAKYHYNNDYVQSIASVDFVDSTGNVINPKTVRAVKYPTEAEAVEYKPYQVKVTSDVGNDITNDCQITLNAVGGGGIDANYFAFVDKNQEDEDAVAEPSKGYARLRQGGESWFGYIKADVVYDPANSEDEAKNTTGSAQIPCAVLAVGTIQNQIIPAEGYPVSMDYYVDEIVDYKATSDDYAQGYDPVLNNWCIVGSSPTRDLLLVKEDGKKALKFTKTGGNRGGNSSSCLGAYAFPAPKAQYVFETIVKFEGASRIGVWNKTPNQGDAVAEWTVSYDDGKITAGEGEISVEKEKWYKVVVTSDPASKLYSVYVSNEDGTAVGSIEGVTGDAAGGFLCVDGDLPVYINSVKAYVPEIETIELVADIDVVAVPEASAAPNEVKLTANCKTADGIALTGKVEWTLAEEYEGVELAAGTQTAVLKIKENASGTISVTASMGGKSDTIDITVTTSKNRVAFITKSSSITIPFEGEPAATAVYLADTITPDSPNGTSDKDIEYTFLDKAGTKALENLPAGIISSVDPETNKLTITVAPGAKPAVFYIKATQKAGDGLSAKTMVNVHGLSYSFGTDEVEDNTQVTAATLYNDTLGYGFESTEGLTDAADKITGTAAYKFKAKVSNGNYKVDVVTTAASMQSEIIDNAGAGANVAGITKSGASFNVAVCDGVLDLTFPANSSVTSLAISQIAAQGKREKPKVYAIGDSTTQNSDFGGISWGSYLALHKEKVPEVFSSFSNNGKSGANSISFYDRGLMETVLLDIHEGDYVTVNMGINWERDGKNDTFAFEKVVDEYFVQAIMDRGGIPVITTSTPIGYNPGKGWTEQNGKIICNRGTGGRNDILRKLAVKHNLNIIELSYYGEKYFNELTMEDVTAYNTANGTNFATTIELARSWWADHNHYKEPVAVILAEYMMDCLAKIAGGSDEFDQAKDPHINEQ